MIVIVQSLDVSIADERVKGSFEETRRRYELFTEFDKVVLLTQDVQDFSYALGKVIHVPCGFSKYSIIRSFISLSSYFRWFYVFLLSFCWLIRNYNDIKVLISENIDSPAPLIVSMLFKIPYVIYYRYDVGSQVKWINKRSIVGSIITVEERFAFKRVNGLWVTSPHLASIVKSFGRQKRTTVIPNWITVTGIANNKVNRSSNEKTINTSILFVGRLHPVKQVDLLVKAFHLLCRKDISSDLYILGEGEERQNITELVNSLGLTDRVHLLGFVDRPTVLKKMKESDVLVLCSKIEGNPRVLLEAMLCKIPIVATNVPGISDMIQHEKTGYLVNNPRPEELADAIEYILRNRRLSHTMINQAYNFARKNFSKETAAKKIRQELNSIVV